MRIYWATRLRGFIKHISEGIENVEFVDEGGYYETNSTIYKLISSIVRKPILNATGVFSIPKIRDKKADYYASFNRFLNSDKPYFIYLENPTALYHYTLGRNKSYLGKMRFEKALNDNNLKGIVCMSNACRNSFGKVNGILPSGYEIKTIYPLVPNNSNVSKELIASNSHRKELKLLFCVQGVRFVSKGGLETVEAYKILSNKNENIKLTIITKIADIDSQIVDLLRNTKGITLFDFSFTYDELEKIYADTNILIQPTSDDSFALTVLEAMKGGTAIVASSMYAIPEMVEDGINGFLVEPKFWFFDKNNIPNPKVWNNRSNTIYSKHISIRLINELVEKIEMLNMNRDLLCKMSLASFEKANDDMMFGENGIRNKWIEFLEEIQ